MISAIPAIVTIPNTIKRGPGRPKSTGPTVLSLRAEIKALGGWVRGKGCHAMNKEALLAYVEELKAVKTAH